MSLTSYRAAPPRAGGWFQVLAAPPGLVRGSGLSPGGLPPEAYPRGPVLGLGPRVDWKTWRRPTLPCLKTQYHGRWGFSRPSSGWDRVRAPRHGHQVVQSTLGTVVSFHSSIPRRVDGGGSGCVLRA